jgi:hypothetical protein
MSRSYKDGSNLLKIDSQNNFTKRKEMNLENRSNPYFMVFISSRVVANSARVSNPRCFGVEACESFIFNLRGLSCLYSLVFSFINILFLSKVLSCFSMTSWMMSYGSTFLSINSTFLFLICFSKTSKS